MPRVWTHVECLRLSKTGRRITQLCVQGLHRMADDIFAKRRPQSAAAPEKAQAGQKGPR